MDFNMRRLQIRRPAIGALAAMAAGELNQYPARAAGYIWPAESRVNEVHQWCMHSRPTSPSTNDIDRKCNKALRRNITPARLCFDEGAKWLTRPASGVAMIATGQALSAVP